MLLSNGRLGKVRDSADLGHVTGVKCKRALSFGNQVL